MFSYLLARMFGVNLLVVGTRNPGGMNAWRQVHPLVGIVGGVADVLKGTFAIYLSMFIGLNLIKLSDSFYNEVIRELIIIGSGISVIIGHQKSLILWLFEKKWIGGKGLSVFGGIILAFSWIAFILLFAVLMGLLQIPKKLLKAKTNIGANIVVAVSSLPVIWYFTMDLAAVFTLLCGICLLAYADKETLQNIAHQLRSSLLGRSHSQTQNGSGLMTTKTSVPLKTDYITDVALEFEKKHKENQISLTLDDFIKIIQKSLENIERLEEKINFINVFPVPDGDTGTNMKETFKTFLSFLNALKNKKSDSTNSMLLTCQLIQDEIIKMGHGNSGLIFTQWLDGIIESLCKKEPISPYNQKYENIGNYALLTFNITELIIAFKEGYTRAYTAINNPKEGTILTVMRHLAEIDIYQKLKDEQNTLSNKYYRMILKTALESLKETHQGMEKLAGVKVIDAGALVFTIFINSFISYLFSDISIEHELVQLVQQYNSLDFSQLTTTPQGEQETFCLQFTVEIPQKTDIKEIKRKLESYGNSIKIAKRGMLYRIHIHTTTPEEVLDHEFGDFEIADINIDNINEQIAQLMKKSDKK